MARLTARVDAVEHIADALGLHAWDVFNVKRHEEALGSAAVQWSPAMRLTDVVGAMAGTTDERRALECAEREAVRLQGRGLCWTDAVGSDELRRFLWNAWRVR